MALLLQQRTERGRTARRRRRAPLVIAGLLVVGVLGLAGAWLAGAFDNGAAPSSQHGAAVNARCVKTVFGSTDPGARAARFCAGSESAAGADCRADGTPLHPEGLPCRFYAQDSFWNRPLPNDAPVDAKSDAWVSDLRRQLDKTSPWINTTEWSIPIYTVAADRPKVRVQLDAQNADLQRDIAAVPLPDDAVGSGGTDKQGGSDAQAVVWQPSTDTLWEFWQLRKEGDGWHAKWGGKMTDVSRNPGYFQAPFGSTASSLGAVGGLITLDDLRSGQIDHALAFAIPEPAKWDRWTWPAQRSDGWIDSPSAIPEGARFRLPADLDLTKLGLTRPGLMLARAMQRYGLVLRDKSGSVALYGQDPRPLGRNPWPELLGMQISDVFKNFPWGHLQALRSRMNKKQQ